MTIVRSGSSPRRNGENRGDSGDMRAKGEPAAEVAARLGITDNALRQIKHRVGRMIAAVEEQYEGR